MGVRLPSAIDLRAAPRSSAEERRARRVIDRAAVARRRGDASDDDHLGTRQAGLGLPSLGAPGASGLSRCNCRDYLPRCRCDSSWGKLGRG